MKLSINGIKEQEAWKKAGIARICTPFIQYLQCLWHYIQIGWYCYTTFFHCCLSPLSV